MINQLVQYHHFYALLGQQITIVIATYGDAKPKQGSIGFIIAQAHNREHHF